MARGGSWRPSLPVARQASLNNRHEPSVVTPGSYVNTVHSCLELQNQAAELKLRAERKLGELLQETVPHGGGRPTENPLHDERGLKLALADQGISEIQSHRWQKVASVPDGPSR